MPVDSSHKKKNCNTSCDLLCETIFCDVPGSPLSKIGIELTDSAYVAINMRIMTRVGTEVMRLLARGAPFVKCMHSVGVPLQDGETSAVWPCNPENVMIAHKPDTMEILRWVKGTV